MRYSSTFFAPRIFSKRSALNATWRKSMNATCDECRKATRPVEYTATHIFKNQTVELCAKCAEKMVRSCTVKDLKKLDAKKEE